MYVCMYELSVTFAVLFTVINTFNVSIFLQSHSDECQYEDVTCDDCDEEMQRRFLDTHLTSECSERVVQCVYCKDEFAFWRLEVSLLRYIKGLG